MGSETLFRDKPVWRAIIALAVPSVLTILIMVVYNIADMFFISMLGDDDQVAAVAVVGPIFSLATAVATMIGAGGCAVIARTLGAGDREQARTLSSLCVWAAIGFGAVFTLLLLTATDPILRLLGATENLIPQAGTYMRILALGTPLMLFSLAMASTIRAEGSIMPGMISNMAGTVTNLVLDPLFILAFRMGVAGAALATVLGNLVSSVMLVRAVRKHASAMAFSPRYSLRQPALLLHILAVGLPNGVSSILSGLASTFSNRLLNAYGSGAIAAMAAAGRSVMVITMVQMGICMGVSPLLAYNCGAGNRSRLREALQKTAALALGFGLVSGIACFFGREVLIGLFLKDTANLTLGSRLMTWLILASPFLGFYYLSSNFLQAAGKAFQATLVSVLRQGVLLIPALYLMHALFGLTGIAAAHTAADFGAILAASVLGLRGYRQIAAADHSREHRH
ncbi:MAG: MATE family efflux transporter [Oscillospiraceae bacterium]|nr:MATE family efflux transporter [Oscillospiraceae bacterium]